MELYDSNNDGKLDAKELEACPGTRYSLEGPESIDRNADGVIDVREIRTRIQAWNDMKVGLTCPIIRFVNENGIVPENIIGKNVTFVPDPLHNKMLKKTEPTTIDENGQCSPSVSGNIDGLFGLPYGFYTIKIEGTSYKNIGVEIFDGAKKDEEDFFVIEL